MVAVGVERMVHGRARGEQLLKWDRRKIGRPIVSDLRCGQYNEDATGTDCSVAPANGQYTLRRNSMDRKRQNKGLFF